MRVCVVADQGTDERVIESNAFDCEIIAGAWQESTPQVDVLSNAFAADSRGVRQAWQFHASMSNSQPGNSFEHTALVAVDSAEARWPSIAAREIVQAMGAGMTRVVVSLPRYAFPDAGCGLLSALALELGIGLELGIEDGQAGAQTSADTLLEASDMDRLIQGLALALRSIDLIVAYSDNVPLTGMHGMSGTASLLGDLDSTIAQQREREIAGLLHTLTQREKSSSLAHSAPVQPSHPEQLSEPSLLGHPEQLNLLGQSRPGTKSQTYKDLARNDAAGAAGGAGFALLALGARALPLSRALAAQFDLTAAVAGSDLIVVKQDVVDGRTHHMSTLGTVCEIAARHALPVIVLTGEQIMSTRELAANGVSACYVVPDGELARTSARLAKSWTPAR